AVSFTSEVNVPAGLTTSDEWLRANSAQLRVAIAMVVKVREHERVEVRQALLQLCKIILDDLGKPLEDLRGLLLETILILGALELTIRDSRTYQEIKDMISAHDLLPDQLRAVLHSWISKLPSVAEGTDENQTQSLLSQISVAHRICRDLDFDISFLHRTLLKHLLWSVDYCLQTAKSLSSGFVGIREIEGSQQLISMLDKGHLQAEVFPNLSIKHSLPIGCLQTFVHDLARNGPAMEYLQELAAEIVSRNDDNLPAILWLIARISVACGQGASANHDGGLISSTVTDTLSIAYSRSVDVLTSGVHRMNDWKLEALSLEIISIHACQLLEGVELDLVDVLLPVIERIDSPQPELRNAAMSCLEVLTSACGAASPSTLVVQNADYLVNALSLKFHAFNIDHQSPRVLVMIIELCGSGIVPYLDDIVDSLISTIAAYHGYPKIVASLFMVLDAIVRLVNIPAINSKQSKRAVYMRPVSCRYVQVQDIPSIIEQTKSLSGNGTVADRGSPCESENQAGADYTDKDSLHAHPVAQPPHRITAVALSIIRSAQHHLTSEVPGIRLQLLSMVMAGCRALSDMRDDDMLPLLNDIWPVIYRRIYDADSNVKIAAMETLDILFQSSGDFLSSRVQNEWHKIRDLASETRSRLNVRINGSAYRGDFTEARRTWEALLNMLISLMRYLRLTAEMEDGLIDLLTPYSHEHSPLRLALQGMNPDAQWLSGFLSGRLHRDGASTRVPQLHGFTFKDPRSVH
ncbi:MAG: hypothetical protein MMC23_010149, partial [Stictis urceolatum]|nr:hypothetical protein [Stictis urceolata]